jgi:hypothetical protein
MHVVPLQLPVDGVVERSAWRFAKGEEVFPMGGSTGKTRICKVFVFNLLGELSLAGDLHLYSRTGDGAPQQRVPVFGDLHGTCSGYTEVPAVY